MLKNRPRSMYQYSSMAPRLSGQNCKFFMFLLSLNSQKRLGYKRKTTPNIEVWPESLGAMKEYWHNERGLFKPVCPSFLVPECVAQTTEVWFVLPFPLLTKSLCVLPSWRFGLWMQVSWILVPIHSLGLKSHQHLLVEAVPSGIVINGAAMGSARFIIYPSANFESRSL